MCQFLLHRKVKKNFKVTKKSRKEFLLWRNRFSGISRAPGCRFALALHSGLRIWLCCSNVAQFCSLAWEFPHAAGGARKKKQKFEEFR